MSATQVGIIGSYLSPYVRKVLAVLHLKGIAYEIDPIVPFLGDDRFSALSPVRRIPVLIDGDLVLTDSTVICEYLEERHPEPALLPRDIGDRARARWLEEYADTRMGEVLIWGLFNQVAINPYVWGTPTDQEAVAKLLNEDIPQVLDYLELQVPTAGFLFGPIGIPDVAIASFFRNAAFARFKIDETRWPRTAAFVTRVLDHDCFARLRPFEERSLKTRPAEQREAVGAIGAPLMATSYGTATPRRGMMRL